MSSVIGKVQISGFDHICDLIDNNETTRIYKDKLLYDGIPSGNVYYLYVNTVKNLLVIVVCLILHTLLFFYFFVILIMFQ